MGSLPLIKGIASSTTRHIISRWARTQSLDLVGQMELGIRYLDLRIAFHEGDFHATHTLMKEESVFVDLGRIAAWLRANPLECLILDLQHFYALAGDAHESFARRLAETFTRQESGEASSSMLVDREAMHSPLGEILDRGQQVVVLYGDDCRVPATGVVGSGAEGVLNGGPPGNAKFWPRTSGVNSIWVNKRTVTDLIPALSDIVTRRAAAGGGGDEDRFWVLQGVLTADGEDIKHSPGSTLKAFGAESVNATLAQEVPRYFQQTGRGWIIIMDFVEIGDWITRVIEANH